MAHKQVLLSDLPIAVARPSPFEIFVKMPSTGQMVVLLQKGEVVSSQRWSNLERLSTSQSLYVSEDVHLEHYKQSEISAQDNKVKLFTSRHKPFLQDVLSSEVELDLKNAYQKLMKSDYTGGEKETSKMISKMADELYAALLPEVATVREGLLKNIKNIQQMSDSSAISALALMCAVANDFKSKTVLYNLCMAALLMDASLADLRPQELETYYRNRSELPLHLSQKISNHPLQSQQMVASMPIVNDAISQLILMHHELHNGKGYHRGLRTQSSPGLCRILSIAVDLYEYIRGAELNHQAMSLEAALLILEEKGVEPHLRRHSARIVDNVRLFLK
jgi:HD-GYP domain-containing protein (c-di-GMP phosphodiesterase class II)